MKYIAYTFFLMLLLTGCYGNDICFESGSVHSVDDINITKLVLQKSDGSSYTWRNTDIDYAKSTLKLTDLNPLGYEIKKFGDVLTEQGDFFSNSSYTIINYSRGDVDNGKISFNTDSIGLPINVNNICEN